MQVKLRQERDVHHGDPRHETIQWKIGPPFCVNPRAILVHRIKSARTHRRDGEFSHFSVTYWCNNIGRGEFVEVPPKGRLLCAACEARAVAAGETTAAELAGRHVHLGRLKAFRVCCTDENN